MKVKRTNFLLSLGASFAVAMLAAPVFGQTVVVDDNVAADGTTSLDAQYFPSSSGSALEINPNSIGLVSGSSGRVFHGIFPAVTLTDVGDSITLNYTFMTPMTIGMDEDNAFRFGLFDTLGRETPLTEEVPDPNDPTMTITQQVVIDGVPQTEGVFGATTYSTANPNDLYGNVSTGVPSGLPGFSASYDHMDDAPGVIADEVQIRQSNIDFPSGRFIGTTSGFAERRNEPADDGAGLAISGFLASTMYSGTFTIERTSMTEVTITTSINLPGYTDAMTGEPIVVSTADMVEDDVTGELVVPDPVEADSFTFDMLAFGASSGAWGTSNTIGDPNNGLDFLSIQITTTGDVEETSLVGDFDGNGVVDCDDLDGYIGNIGADATGMLAALDFDGNGTLTGSDADMVIAQSVTTSNGVTGTFPGDVNCDGSVNVLGDAFALVGSLGGSATMYSQGDVNFDGIVNVLGDAFILVGNLGMNNAAP